DEAFADFVEGLDRMTRNRPPNVFVLLSLTKFFAIPGLRLGCGVCSQELAREVRRKIPPWSVNVLAQAVGEAALNDASYPARTREAVMTLRKGLAEDLQAIPGLTVYPGEGNFLLVRLGPGMPGVPVLAERMLEEGVAIRVCTNFAGLDERFFRVAVRTEEENERLILSLSRALGRSGTIKRKRKTPAIMFQGTSSNAGKSVLAAALCRILLQDGYRVAPFKAQNMSLNSYVTPQGGEMGRAQVVQAQACRLEPDVRMNPILLKPNSDTGSQIIVMGQPVGNMDVGEYVRYKPAAFRKAREAFDSLAAEFDVIVLEGAGSPAEVNLKSHDIVNMQMARYARSPVLLVGDIDRGGVFASFVGTMEVLAEWERKLVAGFLINRFRGEEALLGDAIEYTRRHTGLPTFGVVPYLHNLGLPEEDSVSFKSFRGDAAPSGEAVEVAVIDLPHISNFTDFDSLRVEPDVHVRTIRRVEDLNQPDAVILPGSKNVIGDLEYLRRTGLEGRIADLARKGKTEIVGLCGGLQIIGAEIADPYGIESEGKTLSGLGLLPLTTVMAREKTLRCVSGKHVPSGIDVKGYEIHHGKTEGMNLSPVVLRDDGEIIGSGGPGEMVWGTYLHGIFDTDSFRRWFIDRLRSRKGLAPIGRVLAGYDLEPAFERLAEVVRRKLNVSEIYRLMGIK
ncbi:MAG TPA: cobyric acid synthase, partial [Thermodesulfobacteriota bacterium]|nr:cobyric acid synthase [Thermodesulfobacteriota bacterium]